MLFATDNANIHCLLDVCVQREPFRIERECPVSACTNVVFVLGTRFLSLCMHSMLSATGYSIETIRNPLMNFKWIKVIET